MTDTSPKILIVDDEPQIRRFLGIALRAQGYHVVEAADGTAALAVLAGRGIDLVILDLGLPDLDGKSVLRELRAFSPVPVLVLSVRSDEQEKVAALDAGANDYVTKPFGLAELHARVRVLLRALPAGAPASEGFDDGHLRIDVAQRRVSVGGAPVALSRKEWALLALLLRHSGRVVTHPQLLRELWGPEHLHDSHYLRILVGRLRARLGDSATAQRYIATEPGVGLRFVG